MNITQIEKNVSKLIKNFNKESFIYDLLLAYDIPKATVAKLKVGNLNLSKVDGQETKSILWKPLNLFALSNLFPKP